MLATACLAVTLGLLVVEELLQALAAQGGRLPARARHAALRQDWLEAVSAARGSEVLAVQTLRNSMMSAAMTASAATLGLMGTVGLLAPAWGRHGSLDATLAAGLALLVLLFGSLVAAALATRHYHHAGYVAGMPVEAPQRAHWTPAAIAHLRRAGSLYSWSLRGLLLTGPVLAFLLHPLAGPPAALALLVLLRVLDRPLAAEAGLDAAPGGQPPGGS